VGTETPDVNPDFGDGAKWSAGKPASTMGFEKRWNPMLVLDRDAFVEALAKEIPPRPAEMERMVQANLGL
jgi:hydroxyacylglutathione hydrolase